MSFEWRTDEDKGWTEETQVEETAAPGSRWRRWRFLLVALLGLLGVWLVVQWQINQRVSEATNTIETELLGVHNFVLQTAVNQDELLFRANLSGRNPDWGDVQKTMITEGLFLDRPMLGWHHEPDADRLAPEDVTFVVDPDLQGAELIYPQTYAVQTTPGFTTTITLQQTAVYRQGDTRWLYSPPYDEFWGEWSTWDGEHLALAYVQRDAAIAERLGQDLDALLAQMCTELADLSCGERLRVNLRLTTDPDIWLTLNKVETMLKAGLRVELPTPTLVGLPTDEVSYTWLYRAYGVQLATAVLAHQIDYDCCRHQLFFRALRDYQLAQLDLQPWPLTEEIFSQILLAGFNGNAVSHWTRRWEEAPPQYLQVWVVEDPDPIWQQVYMLIEFLAAQETAVSPAEMMRLMERSSYQGWLNDVLGGYEQNLFQTSFVEYIYGKTSSGQQAAPPIPLPDGNVTLICDTPADPVSSNVYQYNLAEQSWTQPFANLPANRYIDSIDGEHFVVTEYDYGDSIRTQRFYLMSEKHQQFMEEVETAANTEHWVNYFVWDKDANYLMRYENVEGDLEIALRSLDCPAPGCPELQLSGFPTFSPELSHLIDEKSPGVLTGSNAELQFELYLVPLELEGEVMRYPIGGGGESFWIGNNAFGFVRKSEAGWEVVTTDLSLAEPHVIVQKADLLAEISENERSEDVMVRQILANPEDVMVRQILANPKNPQQLLLHLGNSQIFGPAPSFVFRLTLTPDFTAVEQIDLLRIDPFSGAVGFSPDGLYVMVGDYGQNFQDIVWYLLDQETGQQKAPIETQGFYFSWSPDGQWYVQNSANFLLLHAPRHDYTYFVPHGFSDCHQVILSVEE